MMKTKTKLKRKNRKRLKTKTKKLKTIPSKTENTPVPAIISTHDAGVVPKSYFYLGHYNKYLSYGRDRASSVISRKRE